ncbi:MAG: hypothetical protein F7B59_01105 [Desulfurococcales archaeon]|nr:hypothetical protein [Desulfurococcales archaeon]
MSLTVNEKTLRSIIREEVRKAVLEALLEMVPVVDDVEQAEIDGEAGSPEEYEEEDFVEWSGS